MYWQKKFDDTAPIRADKILPLEFDIEKLERTRKAGRHQPEYILERYFK